MSRLPFFAICLLVMASKAAAFQLDGENFVSVNTLEDGEVETRIRYGGMHAKETAVDGGHYGIKFRQLSDGERIIQLIYDTKGEIQDCEFLHTQDQVEKFLNAFEEDVHRLAATSNVTVKILDDRPLPKNLNQWMDYSKLKKQCKKRHKILKRRLLEFRRFSSSNSTARSRSRTRRSFLILPGTLWCGPQHDASSYKDLGNFYQTDKCCRRHDHCRMTIPPLATKYRLFNSSPFTMSHCRCDNRHKRDISDLLRVPGTKWCGKGFSADKYTRLGGFSRTDKCCRKHDTSCPFWISGFQTKYGLFNWRVNTIMHCSCDERFRACLKLADTSDANLVGKIFFNVVQTQCFVLKPKKMCVRRSWWGKCEKVKYTKRAILRNNIPY